MLSWQMNPIGIWSAAGEGERLWSAGVALTTIIVPGEAVAGRFALMEFLAGHHLSPPLHSHPQDETFYLLEGVMTFRIGEERFLFESGATAVVPSGVKHQWRVDSDTARMLVLSTPAGLDRMFRDLSVPAMAPTLPPADAPALSPEEIERVFELHHHENFGPPLGPDD